MRSPFEAGVVKIRVLGETWRVPRGFGAAYRRVVKDHLRWLVAGEPGPLVSEVIDLLELIGYSATSEQVADWDLRRRVEAVVFAVTEHARASDNPVRRHPHLGWLPAVPWRGPSSGEGLFEGPGGTSIPRDVG